ncbi:MAG: alpha/beta hydrolase, partial [Chloroflexota bacterium]
IHGSYGGSWMFENYLKYLSNGGWDSYAMNLRGHYKCQPCELWGVRQWEYARDVLAVAKTLPAPPILIGFGMGAQLVQIAFSLKVKAAGAVFISAKRAFFNPQEIPQQVLDMPKLVAGEQLSSASDMPAKVTAAFNAQITRQIEPLSCFLALLNGEFKIPYLALQAPYLVLNGELDSEISQEEGAELAKIYAGGGSFERIPGASHEGILAGYEWRHAANVLNYWLQTHNFHNASPKGK